MCVTGKDRSGIFHVAGQAIFWAYGTVKVTASYFIKPPKVPISHGYCTIKIQYSLGVRKSMKEERRNARLRILYLI